MRYNGQNVVIAIYRLRPIQ